MLDLNYMDEVVRLAQNSDSNALAEIYAATCRKQYAFALGYLKDEFSAQDALQECYVRTFTNMARVGDGLTAVAHITCANFETCHRLLCEKDGTDPENTEVCIDGAGYSLKRLKRLQLSAYICLVLKNLCGMRVSQIASLLEIRRTAVRRYISSGKESLHEQV